MPGKKLAPHHRTQNRFREREVTRMVRAAKASGMSVKEITVDPKTGKISILVGSEEGHPSPGASRA